MRYKRAILFGPTLDVKASSADRKWLRRVLRSLKLGQGDFLVGVDGGMRVFSFLPGPRALDLIVGDWDSVSQSELSRVMRQGCRMISLSPQKSRSDLFYALKALQTLAVKEVVLIGFSGLRPDHHLAGLIEIMSFTQRSRGVRTVLHGLDADYLFVTASMGQVRLKGLRGQTVSVLPLLGRAKGVQMHGFEYELKDSALAQGSHGLSNRVIREDACILVRQGGLVVIIPKRHD